MTKTDPLWVALLLATICHILFGFRTAAIAVACYLAADLIRRRCHRCRYWKKFR